MTRYVCGYCETPVNTADEFNSHNCSGKPKPFRAIEDYLTKTEAEKMTGFKKFDSGKRQWHLMPKSALSEVVKVLEFGAEKYGSFNWLEHSKDVKWTRYLNALERHLVKFQSGVNNDDDSNLPELAHLICNAIMLLEYQLHAKGIDDRYKPSGGENV
jgi:hypothetical protein